ncbi:MAG: glycosyltransferase family 39 protein [Nitrospirota bacterium]
MFKRFKERIKLLLPEEERKFLCLLMGISLFLRLGFIFLTSDAGVFSDMIDYDNHALALLHGKYELPDRGPLYPLFLAIIYFFLGHSYLAVRIFQVFLGTFTCLMVYFIGKEAFNSKVGKLASLFTAFYTSLISYTTFILSENLFIPLFCLLIYTLFLAYSKKKLIYFIFSGIVLGLASFTRPVILPFILFISIWIFTIGLDKKIAFKSALVFIFTVVCLIVPWSLRMSIKYKSPILIEVYGGYNFLIGNNPLATGRFETKLIPILMDKYCKNAKDIIERERISFQEGIGFIMRNPINFFQLCIKKLRHFLSLEGREFAWVYGHNYFGHVPKSILILFIVLLIVPFIIISCLAISGICLFTTFDAKKGLLLITILYYIGIHLVFFGESRFHLPIVPFLSIFAAAGFYSLKEFHRRYKNYHNVPVRSLLAILLIGILFIFWSIQFFEQKDKIITLVGHNGNLSDIDY